MKKYACAVIVAVVFTCISCNKTGNTAQTGSGGSLFGGSKTVPAVNLLDNVYIWNATDGKLDEKPLPGQLDMGSAVEYMNEEQTFGQYSYAKIRTNSGSEGWISAYRVAENAVPAVVAETTVLYTFPLKTCPSIRRVPAGQIVGVFCASCAVNGFVKIAYCTYKNDGTYTDRYTGYVPLELLSSSKNDIECALFMVRANRDSSQWTTCATFAGKTNSIFNNTVSFSLRDPEIFNYTGSDNPETSDNYHDGKGIPVSGEIPVISIPLLNGSEPTRWLPAFTDGNPCIVRLWSQYRENGAKLDQPVSSNITQHPDINELAIPVESTVLMQNLSLKDKDEKDPSKLVWKAALNLGESVHLTGQEFTDSNKVTYAELTRVDGTTGWAYKDYIAENSFPSYIPPSSESPCIFKEQKTTSYIKDVTLSDYQVIAIHKIDGVSDDWVCISYVDQNTRKLRRNVYVEQGVTYSNNGKLNDDNVTAAILLAKLNHLAEEEFKNEDDRTSYQFVYANHIENCSDSVTVPDTYVVTGYEETTDEKLIAAAKNNEEQETDVPELPETAEEPAALNGSGT